jgi:uncharacterized protein (DUF1778 family)
MTGIVFSVSEFPLPTSVPIADEIVNSSVCDFDMLFRLDQDAWEDFNSLLDAPVRDIPELRDLFAAKPLWEQ